MDRVGDADLPPAPGKNGEAGRDAERDAARIGSHTGRRTDKFRYGETNEKAPLIARA